MSVTNACSISVGREGRCSALFLLLPLLLLLLLLLLSSTSLSLSLFVSSRPRSIVSLPLEESARSRRCPVRPIDDELLLLLLYRSSISNPPSAAKPLLSSRGRFGVCICIYVCMLCYHALVHAARYNKLGGGDESR